MREFFNEEIAPLANVDPIPPVNHYELDEELCALSDHAGFGLDGEGDCLGCGFHVKTVLEAQDDEIERQIHDAIDESLTQEGR